MPQIVRAKIIYLDLIIRILFISFFIIGIMFTTLFIFLYTVRCEAVYVRSNGSFPSLARLKGDQCHDVKTARYHKGIWLVGPRTNRFFEKPANGGSLVDKGMLFVGRATISMSKYITGSEDHFYLIGVTIFGNEMTPDNPDERGLYVGDFYQLKVIGTSPPLPADMGLELDKLAADL